MNEMQELLNYVKSQNRVCPIPDRWQKLSKLIDANKPGHPYVPLILAGWAYSSNDEKRQRLIEQIEYSFTLPNDIAQKFRKQIYALKPDEWYLDLY